MKNMDFLDRFARLERRVRDLESMPSAYMESIIVGGQFLATTEVPPFFTPFGGGIVAVYARFISGTSVEVKVRKNTVDITGTINLAAASTTYITELDPPVYVDEGDIVEADIFGTFGTCTGLSVGVIIHP